MCETSEKANWGTAVAAALFIFCLASDHIMMPLATSSVVQDLNTNMRMVQIAIVLVSLVAAPLYISGNKLGEIHGKRKMFLVGVILFVVGPISAILTPNVLGLVIGWSVTKALGMVLAVPASIGLLAATYQDEEQRKQAFTIYGFGGFAAALAGPLLMGISTQIASWRLPYGFLVLIILLTLLLTNRSMQETEKQSGTKIDWGGTILMFFAVASFLFGAILLAVPFAISLLLAFVLFGMGMVITAVLWSRLRKIEAAGGQPLFSVKLFKNRTYFFASAALLLSVTLAGAIPFIIPVFVEQALRFDTMQGALILFTYSIGSVLFGYSSGYLLQWISSRRSVQLFLVILIVGLVWLAAVTSLQMTLSTFLLPMFLIGAGFGVVGAQLPTIQMANLESSQQDDADGVAEFGQELGVGLGTAVMGSIMFNVAISRFVDNFDGWSGNLAQISQEAFVAGFQTAVGVLALFVFFALLCSFFIPEELNA